MSHDTLLIIDISILVISTFGVGICLFNILIKEVKSFRFKNTKETNARLIRYDIKSGKLDDDVNRGLYTVRYDPVVGFFNEFTNHYGEKIIPDYGEILPPYVAKTEKEMKKAVPEGTMIKIQYSRNSARVIDERWVPKDFNKPKTETKLLIIGGVIWIISFIGLLILIFNK